MKELSLRWTRAAGGYWHGTPVGDPPIALSRPGGKPVAVYSPHADDTGLVRRVKLWTPEGPGALVVCGVLLDQWSSRGDHWVAGVPTASDVEILLQGDALVKTHRKQPEVDSRPADWRERAKEKARKARLESPRVEWDLGDDGLPVPPAGVTRIREEDVPVHEDGRVDHEELKLRRDAIRRRSESERLADGPSANERSRIKSAADRHADRVPLDMCVTSPFEPGESEWSAWEGDVSSWPPWMMASSLSSTPPKTGGGAHGMRLVAHGLRGAFHIRINGVWCWGVPIHGEGGGSFMLSCDPADLLEVREWDGEELDWEPVPPRSRGSVRALHHLVGGLPEVVYWMWTRAVREIDETLMGMTVAQGQVDYHDNALARDTATRDRLQACLASSFKKRPRAYRDYDINDWLDEVGGKPMEWQGRISTIEGSLSKLVSRREKIAERVSVLRLRHNVALERCLQLESEYAPAIAVLHEAR